MAVGISATLTLPLWLHPVVLSGHCTLVNNRPMITTRAVIELKQNNKRLFVYSSKFQCIPVNSTAMVPAVRVGYGKQKE